MVEYILYVLLLDGEALYVGRTERSDVEIRVKEHQAGKGSEYTKTFKDGDIKKLIHFSYKSDDKHLDIETNLAYCLMKKVGFKNVRGGTFNKVVMKKDPTKNPIHMERYMDEPVEDYVNEVIEKIKEIYPNSKLLKNN